MASWNLANIGLCNDFVIKSNNYPKHCWLIINGKLYNWWLLLPEADELSHAHYSDVIMSAMVSQITRVWMVCSTVCSDADQRKHQCSASLAFVRGLHRGLVNSPRKGPVTQKMFPFDDFIMKRCHQSSNGRLAVFQQRIDRLFLMK